MKKGKKTKNKKKNSITKKNSKRKPRKKYTRTIKRYSLPINEQKWKEIKELANKYGAEKDSFLIMHGGLKRAEDCKNFRQIRNGLVKNKYKSKFNLQARFWKLALKDSLETLDRYWCATRAKIKELVIKHQTNDNQKHYLFKSLKTSNNFYEAVFYGKNVGLGLKLEAEELKKSRSVLSCFINKTVKKSPRVQIYRSFLGEPETYRVFMHKGRQYISIMGLIPRKRICIPLTGRTKISGQIRIVLDFEKKRTEIHYTAKSKVKQAKGEKKAIDLGITEVFTDCDGQRWGTDFGLVLKKYSSRLNNKGKKRNKLHSLCKKYRKQHNIEKAKNIHKNNLGKVKQTKHNNNKRLHLSQIVNHSFNTFFDKKAPCKLIYENLSRMQGKTKNKRFNRLVTLWVLNIVKTRLDFKVLQRCSLLKRVNPAYSSQICHRCGWVHRSNRNNDSFKCLFCGHVAHSDWMAALELLRRDLDRDISLWTPRATVKSLLLQRFRRRLECWDFPFTYDHVEWKFVRQFFGNCIDGICKKLLEQAKK